MLEIEFRDDPLRSLRDAGSSLVRMIQPVGMLTAHINIKSAVISFQFKFYSIILLLTKK